jgi:hypothetical protein
MRGVLKFVTAVNAVVSFVIVTTSALPARADDGCAALGWSVQREKAWFADPKLTHRTSGARLRRIDRAVTLTLEPVKGVNFFLPPAIAPDPGSYAGEVTFFGVPKPGLYEVTLSEGSHIDVFENGMRIKPAAMSSAPHCADARVSGRFDLGEGDLVLVQVTDVASKSIKVAFAAVEGN